MSTKRKCRFLPFEEGIKKGKNVLERNEEERVSGHTR
jgi:hypothetical protein